MVSQPGRVYRLAVVQGDAACHATALESAALSISALTTGTHGQLLGAGDTGRPSRRD
jgi:hypothetical protein